MVRLYSETVDELREEMIEKKNQIAKEAVISTLIGLEQGLDEVKLDVYMCTNKEQNFMTLSMHVKMEDFVETFEKNKEALIELEEYELLTEIQKHLG